jgi:hypothetical protein
MMAFAPGDAVCVDITVAEQLPVDGYEAQITDDIPDVWLPGVIRTVRRDGRYEVDLVESDEVGVTRFLAHGGVVRPRNPDGGCGG